MAAEASTGRPKSTCGIFFGLAMVVARAAAAKPRVTRKNIEIDSARFYAKVSIWVSVVARARERKALDCAQIDS